VVECHLQFKKLFILVINISWGLFFNLFPCSISTERHRAEVRRAVNDEKLTTVADTLSLSNISSEWLIEGRRLIPLMPRLVPQTAFTGLANNAATMQLEKNASMPTPGSTGCKAGEFSLQY
jgi:hypothetical protein